MTIMEPLKGGQLANPPAEALKLMNASAVKRTPVDWALQYLWNRPEVATVLSGMGSQQMVDENCASADRSGVGSLNSEEEATIDRIAEIYRERILVPCTGCEYCMPCPVGINIPKNFAILNSTSLENSAMMRWQVKRGYKKLTGDPQKTSKDNPNGNATVCIECGQCLEKCPQEINIPEELKKVNAILGRREKISKHYPR